MGLREWVRDFGTRLRARDVIEALEEHGELGIIDIAHYSGLSTSTLDPELAELSRQGRILTRTLAPSCKQLYRLPTTDEWM